LRLGEKYEHGSDKSYAFGVIVDMFSGVLRGASYGPWAPPFPAYIPMPENMPGKGLGHFLGAMRVDAFRPADEFKSHMDHWINRFRNAIPVDGLESVLIPGDPEREMEMERMTNGIPLLPIIVDDLQKTGDIFQVALTK